MAELTTLGWIARILVIVGALNWGLIGLLDFNLVTTLFGSMGWLVKTIYILVGLAAIWEIVELFK